MFCSQCCFYPPASTPAGHSGPSSALNWSVNAGEAFVHTKSALTEACILSQLHCGSPLAIQYDASDLGRGAVLEQFTASEWHPLGFFSHMLSTAECLYSSQELLTAYAANCHSQSVIEEHRGCLFTDHHPLAQAVQHVSNPVVAATSLCLLKSWQMSSACRFPRMCLLMPSPEPQCVPSSLLASIMKLSSLCRNLLRMSMHIGQQSLDSTSVMIAILQLLSHSCMMFSTAHPDRWSL